MVFSTAERAGFEPAKPFRGLHAFQACLFNHSSISPFRLIMYIKKQPASIKRKKQLLLLSAEKEGFEPPEPLSSTVFKTAAIDHSAIFPISKSCDLGGARTLDPMIKSHLLYQLSYGVNVLLISVAKVMPFFYPTKFSGYFFQKN